MKLGIPPYFIVSDAHLADLVTLRPANAEVLLCVKGFGPAKLQSYGDDLLQAVREQAQLLNLPLCEVPPFVVSARSPKRPPAERAQSRDAAREQAFAAFTRGDSMGDVCVKFDRAPAGVGVWLLQFALENGLASLEPWLSDALLAEIECKASALGAGPLQPLHAALDGQVSYTQLRLALGFLASRLGATASEPVACRAIARTITGR